MCKQCKGFWKSKRGSSRFVQIQGRHKGKRVSLQLILDEPTSSPRLPSETSVWTLTPTRSVGFASAGSTACMEHISDLLWGIIFSNPEADGLKQIHDLAAKRLQGSHR